MTKKPKLELYPIKRVHEYEFGKVKSTYWVVQKPDGAEISCKDYETAETYQQEHRPMSGTNKPERP